MGVLVIFLIDAVFVKCSYVHKVCKTLLQKLTAPFLLPGNVLGGFFALLLDLLPCQ